MEGASLKQRPGTHVMGLAASWLAFGALGGGLLAAAPARATEVRVFVAEGSAEMLAGELAGVSLDSQGRLRLAEKVEKVAGFDEPYLLSAVARGQGWVVGTGDSGRVFELVPGATPRLLFTADEAQVFALWADPDGTVFAGTSPGGKVYRLPVAGGGELFFDSGETYVWALARAKDGRLLVATGTNGKLFAVGKDGRAETLLDLEEPHLRSLLALPAGGALIGTAGEGRVVRLDAAGSVSTLYDAPQPEIVALTAGADGVVYAAALASEASQVDLSKREGKAPQEPAEGAASGDEAPAGDPAPFSGTGSRPASFQGARAELVAISPTGLVESLWSFQEETVYSLFWHRDRLWIGTGQEGKVYTWRGEGVVLETRLGDKQVVRLLPQPGGPTAAGPAFATTNGAALYRTVAGSAERGTFISRVLDAGAPARFGTLRWAGADAPDERVEFSVRSGAAAKPDATWSAWSALATGAEVDLSRLPAARYVQWKAELAATAKGSPRLDVVEISYRQLNARPKIESLEVLEPGQVLAPANFNPGMQVYEPAHPTRDGIFTSLSAAAGRQEGRVKPLWKLGYRSLRWQAQDPNGDPLSYALFVRKADGDEASWLPMVKDLDEDLYGFDATVLPDGVYLFRLVASDERGNTGGQGLEAEKLSGRVVIDHTAPRVVRVRRDGKKVLVEVSDAFNPLREAVLSVDAGEWQPVQSMDGLVDGRTETLVIEPPATAKLLLLRLTDAAHNVVTVDLAKEQR